MLIEIINDRMQFMYGNLRTKQNIMNPDKKYSVSEKYIDKYEKAFYHAKSHNIYSFE